MEQSKDLKFAMRLRDEEKLTIAIAKDEQVLFTSKDIGILPLFNAYTSDVGFVGASVADKVVGKGAAMFFAYLKIKEVHTFIISESAYRHLQDNDVVVFYHEKVDFISNRKGDGRCPVETMAENQNAFTDFIVEVECFLKRLGLI